MDNKINEWLQQFDVINEIAEVIHIDTTTDETSLALQRTGFEVLPTRYITDKHWYRQYQYMLLLKNTSEDDAQRLINYDWLDELSDELAIANIDKNFPVLVDKQVYGVGCANAINIETSEDGAESTYSLQLYFNIKGGN